MELTDMLKEIRLVQTCGACPEQYDAFIGDELVGYLRLRHGYFTVQYQSPSGELVYSAEPQGDGSFEDREREGYLSIAKMKLVEKHYKETHND